MRCEDMVEQISAYIDGELPPARRQAVATHLSTCPACAALAQDYRSIGTRLLATAVRQPAPDLAQRLSARLDAEPAFEARAWSWQRSARQAAVLAAVAIVSALAGWQMARSSLDSHHSEREAVTAHVRSLLADRPAQVASADAHTVKPWFTGRLDFSPVVKDLAAEGFPLVGGRLDFLADRRVAALVYARRQHVITVFTWPAAGAGNSAPRTIRADGYNAITWIAAGMSYWAVSDLNAGELAQLQGLL